MTLRNILINTVLKRVHPQTSRESEAAISTIKNENFGNNPKEADIQQFPKEEIRDLLKRLQQLKIADLRNDVFIHQYAYKPRRLEVEKCLEVEFELLYRLKLLLPVYTFDKWSVKTST